VSIRLSKDSLDVALVVRDHVASLAFYCDLLGFVNLRTIRMLTLEAGMVQLGCGSSIVKLIQLDRDALPTPVTGSIDSARGYRYITLFIENLEQVVESCIENGYAVPASISHAGESMRFAIVADPDGNWIELVQKA
jgi:catechol 2,3-dioxygenase-like lactoylglutathione lyase family enzyme